MKKIKLKKENKDVVDGWMGTYGDMITLLMAFFVMLYSTTDPDPLDVVTYNLVLSTDWSDSSLYTWTDDIDDTTITVTLDDNTEYYWIVVAVDKDLQKTLSDDGSPNRIVVGTLGIDGSGVLPTEYAVHQNYPNPFNPVTTLRYDLPEQAHVKIIVYDMLGRKVGTILDQTQDPGF